MSAPVGTVKSLLSRGRTTLATSLRIDDPEEEPQHDEAR
jgi:DNA-directed RNA polymerase specialized sigma24 family protein